MPANSASPCETVTLPDLSVLRLRRRISVTRIPAPAEARKVREKKPGRRQTRQAGAADSPFAIIVPFAVASAKINRGIYNLEQVTSVAGRDLLLSAPRQQSCG